MWSGEGPAWEEIARLDPADVCKRALVSHDAGAGEYRLPTFYETISISPAHRELSAISRLGKFILNDLAYYSRLAILHYLIGARDISASGELAKPYNIGAGQIYFSGTHRLPLEKLAARYGADIEGFYETGARLGSERLGYGDAALRLLPFPRLPVALILWRGDEEFPARADLLFDSTCRHHLPADILWSTAMMTLLAILESG